MIRAADIDPRPWHARHVFGVWVEQISRATLRADVVAGLLGAVLVLPQGIAFATLAGLPPQYGLYTAVIPCAIAALFGSSHHVMSGPTNANSLALFAMLAPLAAPFSQGYIDLALTVTILVGLLQLAVGVLRLGSLSNFISPAALLGFTGGAAALIAIHALRDLFGFGSEAVHGTGELLRYAANHLGQIHPGALLVGVITLLVAVLVRRFNRDWPFMLVGLIGGAGTAFFLNQFGATWTVSLLGAIPSPLPPFHVPAIDWSRIPDLLGLAVALSIVALGQSISV